MNKLIENIDDVEMALRHTYNLIMKYNIVTGERKVICSDELKDLNISGEPVDEDVSLEAGSLDETKDIFIEKLIKPEWRGFVSRFLDKNTLQSRLAKTNRIYAEFETKYIGWQRHSWVVVSRDEQGNAVECLYLSELIEAAKQKEIERVKEIRHQVEINNSLSTIYSSVSYIDIENDTYECIYAKEHILRIIDISGCASESFKKATQSLGSAGYRRIMDEFTDLSTLPERLMEQNAIFQEFYGEVRGWSRSGFIVANRDANGRPTHVLYTIQDIDEVKKKELLHQAELEKSLAISKSLADIYYNCHYIDLKNNQFFELSSDDAIVKMAGHQGLAQQALNQMIDVFVTEPYIETIKNFNNLSTLAERLKDRDVIYEEYISSQHGWIRSGYIVARRDEKGVVDRVLYTNEIIDAQKKHELQIIDDLRIAVLTADRAAKAKNDFLSHMSHEIRTPINGIIGMNEMILRESKETNVIDYAKGVEDSANHLLALVDGILDFSQIENGNMTINETEYSLSSLVKNVYQSVREKAEQKNLKLNVFCAENLPSRLYGDVSHISKLIENLLSNAIKFTEEGKVDFIISSYTSTKMKADSMSLKITIKDTGVGMKEEDRENLFTEFQRFDMEKNQTIEGSGLGLAIVKRIVDMMDGVILVDSVYGQGSTFTVVLPQKIVNTIPIGKITLESFEQEQKAESVNVASSNATPVNNAPVKASPESYTTKNARVLAVDDVSTNLKVFTLLLKNSGLTIDTAMSGRAALELTARNKYDIIFMDHMMPEMNGIDCMKAIKTQENGLNRETPEVMLTANAVAGMREIYLAEGFDDYLAKPIHAKELEKTIAKFLFS